MVHKSECEDSVGCRAPVRPTVLRRKSCHSVRFTNCSFVYTLAYFHTGCYGYAHSANKHPRVVEHSPDNSVACSSSNAGAEPE